MLYTILSMTMGVLAVFVILAIVGMMLVRESNPSARRTGGFR
jgi:hypothetical protein